MWQKPSNPLCGPLDRFGLRRFREWATLAARGRVLEIGVGTGLNLIHYPSTAHAIYAFDPDVVSLAEVETSDPRVHLIQARGEALPFADASFDSAVGTFVFCSISDPSAALAETRRVLRAGAPLRLVEHVRSRLLPFWAVQELLAPTWKRLSGGCHLNRQTRREVQRAGFTVRHTYERFTGIVIGIDATK